MSSTYGTSKSVTIPSDGDTIDAVDVNVPIAAMWDEHDVLADLTALQAILVPTHGLIRYVRGYGHFVFVTSGTYSASTVASPWILTATDGTPGRWVMDLTANSNRTIYRTFGCADVTARASDEIAKTWNPTASATFWDPIDYDGNASNVARSRFYHDAGGIRFYSVNAAAALARHVMFPLNAYLVNGATLSSVLLLLQGQAGGHGALPLVMPSLGVARYDPGAAAWVTLLSGVSGYQDDASANVAAYEAVHSINMSLDQNNTIDLSAYLYYAVVCNEANTNAVSQLGLRQITLTMAAKGYT